MAAPGLTVRQLHHDPGNFVSLKRSYADYKAWHCQLVPPQAFGDVDRRISKTEPYRPWSGSWEDNGAQGKHFMSGRSRTQDAFSGSVPRSDGCAQEVPIQAHLPNPRYADPISYGKASPNLHRQELPPARSLELPPISHLASASGGRFSPLVSHSGPLPAVVDRQSYGAEKHPPLTRETPRMNPPVAPHPVASTWQHNSIPSHAPSPNKPTEEFADRSQRRILNARSPLHRAATLSHLQPQHSAVNAHTSFPSSSYTQPQPKPHGFNQDASGTHNEAPMTSSGHSEHARLRQPSSGPQGHSFARTRRSSLVGDRPGFSGSPTPSYASFNKVEQTSPNIQYPSTRPSPGTQFSVTTDSTNTGAGLGISSSEDVEHDEPRASYGMPVPNSAGQGGYQMMTLETTSGTFHLPVDTQAASRVADEKRRRNAGASARFRERRKRKEVEASTTISKLETRVKNLAEDSEFYRRERDYLASVVMQLPGADHHFPRPQSPRLRRSANSISERSATRASSSAASDTGSWSPGNGRSVRGLASNHHDDYASSVPPQASRQTAASEYAAPVAYTKLPPAIHAATQMYQRTAGSYAAHPGEHELPPRQQLPPPVMQAAPTTGPHNPFASQRYNGTQHFGQQRSMDPR